MQINLCAMFLSNDLISDLSYQVEKLSNIVRVGEQNAHPSLKKLFTPCLTTFKRSVLMRETIFFCCYLVSWIFGYTRPPAGLKIWELVTNQTMNKIEIVIGFSF